MLIPNFYTIETFQASEGQVNARLKLNPGHEVYQGHFPNQPIVPGVIQLQMIKELIEKAVKEKLLLGEMAFAKYLNAIIPHSTPVLNLTIDFQESSDQIKISASIKAEGIVYTKVKGTFTIIKS